jgi:glycolate oxidase iron-sulfur subunit
MLRGVLKGELKMSKTINRYLDLCLKCGACSKFCPSGIDIVDVIITAKAEYFKKHPFEKVISYIQKNIIFGLIPNILWRVKNIKFSKKNSSSKFTKRVLYFGGCGSKFKGESSIHKILNSMGIEVINPNFDCCGIPLFSRGDLQGFEKNLNSYINKLKKYDIHEIVTSCASCEKVIKDYAKWTNSEDSKAFLNKIEVKNIYDYIKNEKFKIKKPETITFHKPCNLDNYELIEQILNNTENLTYIKMNDFDKCCGLNGISKIKEFKIMKQLFNQKRSHIKKTKAEYVLTACLGCEVALRLYSLGQYKVKDLIDYLAEQI